jgi:hypothetical protein
MSLQTKMFIWGVIGTNTYIWYKWNDAKADLTKHQHVQFFGQNRLPLSITAYGRAPPKLQHM